MSIRRVIIAAFAVALVGLALAPAGAQTQSSALPPALVIDPKIAQPVSAGILAVPNDGLIRASFHPATPIESAAAFAISVEKAGGAPKPEGQIILVGK